MVDLKHQLGALRTERDQLKQQLQALQTLTTVQKQAIITQRNEISGPSEHNHSPTTVNQGPLITWSNDLTTWMRDTRDGRWGCRQIPLSS